MISNGSTGSCNRCRALMEQISVSGIQRQTLDSLQEKLNDLETTLTRERDEHQRAIVSISITVVAVGFSLVLRGNTAYFRTMWRG